MAKLPTRRAIILGGAQTLHRDHREALELFEPDLVIACNHAARDHEGRVDHWVSMHPEFFPKWIKMREIAGLPQVPNYWHPRHKPTPIPSNPLKSIGGSSGLFCVAVAEQLHCTHAVLVGVPMVKMENHYDKREPWWEARQYHPAWERQRERFAGWVRSMSGWTKELLGAPDEEWLNADTTRAN